MTYAEKIAGLVDASENNRADGDHASIADNLDEALYIIKDLVFKLDSCNYYLDEVEA